ncbi:hypothetical protein AXF42_Ash001940 [Apostasia shenzhenica]|uniref:Uncharacterized protein n=1 Tax=Apostasia shenzhenica TaxID=1088818 RepID=A0A2I0ABN6_9ASPA|nr:hypothetical protein AXF42_Ash001940 [Apostasia shenzhenica]
MKAPEDVDVGCGGPREHQREREFRETAALKGISLLTEAQQGSEFRAFRETHRGLRWFREIIPYVHRTVSEGVSLMEKCSLEGLYSVFFGKKKEEKEKSSTAGALFFGGKEVDKLWVRADCRSLKGLKSLERRMISFNTCPSSGDL